MSIIIVIYVMVRTDRRIPMRHSNQMHIDWAYTSVVVMYRPHSMINTMYPVVYLNHWILENKRKLYKPQYMNGIDAGLLISKTWDLIIAMAVISLITIKSVGLSLGSSVFHSRFVSCFADRDFNKGS